MYLKINTNMHFRRRTSEMQMLRLAVRYHLLMGSLQE